MTFSIIIPVYNVASYLRECICSVVEAIEQCKSQRVQSKVSGVEIICVNDGSTDGSGAILDEYAAKEVEKLGGGGERRIKVIHQSNQGVSVARNRGIGKSTGDYVCFVDADDTVGSEWLTNYARAIEKYGNPDVIRLKAFTQATEESIFQGDQAREYAWSIWVQNGYVWTYCVKREIAQKAKFPVGVKFCEDSMYEMQLTPYINRIVQLNTNDYHYRVVVGSASNQRFGSEERLKALTTLKKICETVPNIHSKVIAGAIWGALRAWAQEPKDVVYRREILKVFKYLKSRGLSPIYSVPVREKFLALLYPITGWIWPFRTYRRAIAVLVKIKKGLKMLLKGFLRCSIIMRIRELVAAARRKVDPFYIRKWRRIRHELTEKNRPYESGDTSVYRPPIMGLEETLRYVIDRKCSISRFGDGEFELVVGRDMLFETANVKMRERLIEILQNPIPECLTCILNCYNSLDRYVSRDLWFWRDFAVWSREGVFSYFADAYKANPPTCRFGDPQISRPYMVMSDKGKAPQIFDLWKELVKDQNLLIVEGRFSRLGIGNDLLSGAKSIRRIWCPPKGAFAKYDEILAAIKKEAHEGDMIFLALGATATILAYDLAKEGYRAIDAGHVDVEYMWMRMGAMDKVAIPGRYVSEVTGGQEQKVIAGEEKEYNVVAMIRG